MWQDGHVVGAGPRELCYVHRRHNLAWI